MRIGLDLGGTKTEAVALEDDGTVLARERIPTPRAYPDVVAAIVDLVRGFEARLERTGSVGVGMPGALSPATGLIKNANSTCLIGHPLDRDLGRALEREVRLSNDANCFALSEAVDGAGRGADVVFGVIIGTGTGGGVAIGQRVLRGCNAIAGEWGHNPLPRPRPGEIPGPRCYCGRRGCVETFLSGPALAHDFHVATGRSAEPAEIDALARDGDEEAETCLQRYEERMARSLAYVMNLLDPDVIVLGGGLSNLERLYRNVPRLWTPHVFSDRIDTRLAPPRHGDSSGVRGAAWLWPPG